MSVCYCVIAAKKLQEKMKENNEVSKVAKGMLNGFVNIVKAVTYQLQENDLNHIMDLGTFFAQNPELCHDITSKNSQLIISRWKQSACKNH